MILVCVAAGVACVVVILVLVGIVGTQAIMLANQDGEIKCRSTGEGDCKDKGTAVQKYDNLEILDRVGGGDSFMGTVIRLGAPDFRDWEETITFFARICGDTR